MSAPRRSVQDILAQDRHLFRSVPAESNAFVCPWCMGPVTRYPQCYGCLEVLVRSGAPEALRGRIVPMTVVMDPSGWYSRLWNYKRMQFAEFAPTLAAVSWAFVTRFEAEIANALGGEPDVWTIVPSTREGVTFADNRLRGALALVVKQGARIVEALRHVRGETVGRNTYNPDAFGAGPKPVQGARVVLMEDTWLSGSKAVSAAGALYREGARSVVVLPIARKIDLSSDVDYRAATDQPWGLHWPRG